MFLSQTILALRFDIAPKNKMLWRPNQLQMSGLRSSNAASFFVSDVLESSPALKKATFEEMIEDYCLMTKDGILRVLQQILSTIPHIMPLPLDLIAPASSVSVHLS